MMASTLPPIVVDQVCCYRLWHERNVDLTCNQLDLAIKPHNYYVCVMLDLCVPLFNRKLWKRTCFLSTTTDMPSRVLAATLARVSARDWRKTAPRTSTDPRTTPRGRTHRATSLCTGTATATHSQPLAVVTTGDAALSTAHLSPLCMSTSSPPLEQTLNSSTSFRPFRRIVSVVFHAATLFPIRWSLWGRVSAQSGGIGHSPRRNKVQVEKDQQNVMRTL